MSERPTPSHHIFDKPAVQDLNYRLRRQVFEQNQQAKQAAAEAKKKVPASRTSAEAQVQLRELLEQHQEEK